MREKCAFGPCDRFAKTRGWCGGHYEQQRLGKELRILRGRAPDGTWGPICTVHKCDRPQRAKGYCPGHWAQLAYSKDRAIKPLRNMNPGEWSEWTERDDGYVYRSRWLPAERLSERQAQHRWVMEQHLGRRLLPGENVHHINGQRNQNNLDNLEIWSTSQPSGQRIQDKLAWAYEIIALYGNPGLASDQGS